MEKNSIEDTFIEQYREPYYRVSVNVNLQALKNNVIAVKNILNDNVKLMAVIKADGYGHGSVEIAKALTKEQIDFFGIAIMEEGIELREAGITTPILILGYTPACQYESLLNYDISPTIFQHAAAVELSRVALLQNKIIKIHIKIDTGMSRIGFADNDKSIYEIKEISKLQGIQVEGIFTHFACADEKNKTSVMQQWSRFCRFLDRLDAEGISIPVKHAANSAAIIDLPETHLDMVRCGIATYGLYPSDEVKKNDLKLQPVLEMKSHVSFVKEVEEGVGISYGNTFVAKKKMKVATIPLGYGDGYPRALSSKGRVLIRGISAPILGRICMDQFMVDVTSIDDIKQDDIVTLIGKDGEENISVEEMAELAQSFNYEFVCNIGKRVPRVYLY